MKRALLLCLLCMFAANPAMAAETTSPGVIQEAVRRGVLRVGLSSFVPWAMQDKHGGYVGFEVDVASRLARDMGLRLELVPTRWSGIVPALLTGKFDMIIGGLSITAERALRVSFSIPYDYAQIEVVGSRHAAGGRTALAEFDTPETIVAVRTGSTAAVAARTALPKAALRFFDEEATAVREMSSGRAHLLFASAPLGTFEMLRAPGALFSPVKEPLFRQPIAIAIRKGDMDSLNALDSWIRVVEAEGWLRERKAYWFEGREWESMLR